MPPPKLSNRTTISLANRNTCDSTHEGFDWVFQSNNSGTWSSRGFLLETLMLFEHPWFLEGDNVSILKLVKRSWTNPQLQNTHNITLETSQKKKTSDPNIWYHLSRHEKNRRSCICCCWSVPGGPTAGAAAEACRLKNVGPIRVKLNSLIEKKTCVHIFSIYVPYIFHICSIIVHNFP